MILLLVFACLVVRQGVAESALDKINTPDLDYIWKLDTLENVQKGKIKSILSILDGLARENEDFRGKSVGPAEKPGGLLSRLEATQEKEPASTAAEGLTPRPGDSSVEKAALRESPERSQLPGEEEEEEGVNKRSYFPGNVKTVGDLPKPVHFERSAVVSLLAKDKDLESRLGEDSSFQCGSSLSSIVSISNKTEEMPAQDLFRGFVSDVDSICRISAKWFESYPRFVQVLRRTDDKISGRPGAAGTRRSSGSGRGVRLSRRFTNEWVEFLGQLGTVVIDSKSYRRIRRELRTYKEINHKDLEQYRRNVYNELQLFNHLLLSILAKLSFYIQYVVYFPSTGKLFGREDCRNYTGQFKEGYLKQLSSESGLLKLSRMDIYVNKIPRKSLEEVRTSVSSCSGVVKLLHEYGIRPDSTPSAVISLYLQFKRVTRILLNIYNSETDSRAGNPGGGDSAHRLSKKGPSPDGAKGQGRLFDQTLVPNKIGFRPFQTQTQTQARGKGGGGGAEDRRTERRPTAPHPTNDRAELDFSYVSKESALKLQGEGERSLFQLIRQDLSANQLSKIANPVEIADKRPSGTPGLVIFTQKLDMQTHPQHECGAKIMQNGQVEISFQRNLLSGFGDKISSWFKHNYLKHFQASRSGDTIPLQFKLVIACPYVASKACMRNQCGGIHDVYMLVYLVGKLKEYNDEWKIVTEFNAITGDTRLQWKIASILVPDIRSQAEGMCPVQTGSLKSQALKESKHVVFKSPLRFSSFPELFKHENANVKKSILRNCLNYVEEGTTIEFLTNNGRNRAKATCRNSNIYLN